MEKIAFEIVSSGAPYPAECWWRIKGANGKILTASELMSKRNARRSIHLLILAMRAEHFIVKWVPVHSSRKAPNKKYN